MYIGIHFSLSLSLSLSLSIYVYIYTYIYIYDGSIFCIGLRFLQKLLAHVSGGSSGR